eukprot:scaffold7926_cov147-Skeletonema_marinoi.AAC.3
MNPVTLIIRIVLNHHAKLQKKYVSTEEDTQPAIKTSTELSAYIQSNSVACKFDSQKSINCRNLTGNKKKKLRLQWHERYLSAWKLLESTGMLK